MQNASYMAKNKEQEKDELWQNTIGKIPNYIKIVLSSTAFMFVFPATFENEEAIEKFYSFLLPPFFGNLIITPIIMWVVKLLFREKLKMKHAVIAIVIRSGMALLFSSPDLFVLNGFMIIVSMATVYAATAAYIKDRDKKEKV